MAKKNNNKMIDYLSPFDDRDLSRRSSGKSSRSSGGKHSPANIAKLAGPPEASKSIATGTLKTKRQQAQEALEAEQAQWQPTGGVGAYGEPVAWEESGEWANEGWGVPPYGDAYVYDSDLQQNPSGANWNVGGYDNAGYYSDMYVGEGGYAPYPEQSYVDESGYQPYGADFGAGYTDGYGYEGYDAPPDYDAGQWQGAYDGWQGDMSQDGYAQWDGSWQDPSGAFPGQEQEHRGLFGRNRKNNQTFIPPMSLDEKYDAEAQARANANAAVEAYESGVPLGIALGNPYASQGALDGAESSEDYGVSQGKKGGAAIAAGAAAVAGAFAGGRRGGASGSSGVGVQVQIPTASMEKSLNMSTSASHQKQMAAGTGSKVSPSRGSGGRGKRNTYGADKELGAMLRARLLTIAIIILAVLAAAAIGAGVGYFVSLSNRLGLDDLEAVEKILVEPEENEPYYVLFAADLDDTNGSNDDLDAMLLARIDEANKRVQLLAIPGNIEVVLSDYDYHPATEARADGGNAQLISSMSALLGIDIAHLVVTDAQGLATIVDAVGGVEMTLTQEIDDPQAGWEYFAIGTYTLTGEQALTVLRAENFHEGEDMRGYNRCEFAKALMEKILNSGFISFATIADVISGNVQTDFTASEILQLSRTMTGITAADVLSGTAPGSQETTVEGVRVFTPSYTSLAEVITLMEAGLSPVLEDTQGTNVNPANVTVTVWNGSGVVGGAAMLGEILSDAGFDVQEITNAQSYVYTETLIIYDDDDDSAAAYAAQEALGQGRVIDGTWKYTFTTDILVVLGSEWR